MQEELLLGTFLLVSTNTIGVKINFLDMANRYIMTEYTNIIFGEQDEELVTSEPQQKQSKENFCMWILKYLFGGLNSK